MVIVTARIAQAKTGTGKTLAFLIPLIQNILKVRPDLEQQSRLGSRFGNPSDIRAIVISPTRELAEQIAEDARKLTRDTAIKVQIAVGGTQKREALRQLQQQGCHILVATPGRLMDLLSDDRSGVQIPNVTTLVLDEADRLLDQGFLRDIEAIQEYLPSRETVDRQTLLYSATLPREIIDVVRATVDEKKFKFVRTVKDGELQTHEKVPQNLVPLRGIENAVPTLVELCKKEISKDRETPFKAIVFFNTTADSALAAEALRELRYVTERGVGQGGDLGRTAIIEIHSKLTQGRRTKAALDFKHASSAILVSSDVTARGMDFPNVTHIIQMGLPPSEEQYIHRLGRTARADKAGEGWIMLFEGEIREARSRLRAMPLKVNKSLEMAEVDLKADLDTLPVDTQRTITQLKEAFKRTPFDMKAAAYLSGLGYLGFLDSKQTLVDTINNRAIYCWGLDKPPFISPKLVQKLGLSRTHGLEVGYNDDMNGPSDRRGGNGYGGRRDDLGSGYGSDQRSERSGGNGGRGYGGGGYGGGGGGYGGARDGGPRWGGGYGDDRGGYGRGGGGGGGGYGGGRGSYGGDYGRQPSF